jgi:hypothetical protein
MLSIYLAPTKRTQRGQLYEVRLGASDGPVIVERSLDPEHAACRYLAGKGLRGLLEVWPQGRTTARMIIRCIETAAGKTERDDNRDGTVLAKYRPMEEQPHRPLALEAPSVSDNDNGSGEAEVA